MKCLLTIDVEDWYHLLALPAAPLIGQWASMPTRVENNFNRLLDILAEKNIKATGFFLGWIAQKYPALVKRAVAEGHEIASHGFDHRLVYKLSPEEFYDDAVRARKVIEDIGGNKVSGYRAAGFSVGSYTPWFFEKLSAAGYEYDSSLFPADRGHGGDSHSSGIVHRIVTDGGGLTEFPIAVTKLLGKAVCFSGGGYFRLFPYHFIKISARKILNSGQPVVFYLHPREIDPAQPRLAMNPLRKFKSYVGINKTEPKLKKLLAEFEFCTISQYIERYLQPEIS